jgi:hypothetical protein
MSMTALLKALGAPSGEAEYEIPEWLAELLEGEDEVTKAAGHKYIRREPTGNPKRPWRYFYKVQHGGGASGAFDIKEGAAFKVSHNGKEGHFHVLKVEGDEVTIRHDESGHEGKVPKEALRAMFAKEHAGAIESHRDKLKRELSAAEAKGTPKQRERLAKEAAAAGVEPKRAAPPQAPQGMFDPRRQAAEKTANEDWSALTAWAERLDAVGDDLRWVNAGEEKLQDFRNVLKEMIKVAEDAPKGSDYGRAVSREVMAIWGDLVNPAALGDVPPYSYLNPRGAALQDLAQGLRLAAEKAGTPKQRERLAKEAAAAGVVPEPKKPFVPKWKKEPTFNDLSTLDRNVLTRMQVRPIEVTGDNREEVEGLVKMGLVEVEGRQAKLTDKGRAFVPQPKTEHGESPQTLKDRVWNWNIGLKKMASIFNAYDEDITTFAGLSVPGLRQTLEGAEADLSKYPTVAKTMRKIEDKVEALQAQAQRQFDTTLKKYQDRLDAAGLVAQLDPERNRVLLVDPTTKKVLGEGWDTIQPTIDKRAEQASTAARVARRDQALRSTSTSRWSKEGPIEVTTVGGGKVMKRGQTLGDSSLAWTNTQGIPEYTLTHTPTGARIGPPLGSSNAVKKLASHIHAFFGGPLPPVPSMTDEQKEVLADLIGHFQYLHGVES